LEPTQRSTIFARPVASTRIIKHGLTHCCAALIWDVSEARIRLITNRSHGATASTIRPINLNIDRAIKSITD
jgi:hypothetical protein